MTEPTEEPAQVAHNLDKSLKHVANADLSHTHDAAGRSSEADQTDASEATGDRVTDEQPAAEIEELAYQEEQQSDGKEPLPLEEDDQEEESEPVFTNRDRADLPILEKQFESTGIRQAKALREIRQRKLWMLHRTDHTRRKYQT